MAGVLGFFVEVRWLGFLLFGRELAVYLGYPTAAC